MLDNPDTGGDDWRPASTLYGRDNGCDVSRGPYIVLVDMMKVDTRCKEVAYAAVIEQPAKMIHCHPENTLVILVKQSVRVSVCPLYMEK